MRRTVLLLAAVALGVVLTSGAALAANQIDCRDQPDGRCAGTPRADTIRGTNADETIRGLGGNDAIRGNSGSDKILGGGGSDRITAARCSLPSGTTVRGGFGADVIDITNDCGILTIEPPADRIYCGPGKDVVRGAVGRDRIAANCERVVRG